MFKTLSFLTLIICVLSIFIFNNVSFSDDPLSYNKDQLDIRYQSVFGKQTALVAVRTTMVHLNSGWDAKIESAASNIQVSLITGGGAVVSSIVAAVTGGSLIPASYALWVSKIKADGAKTDSVAGADYLIAISETLPQLDTALAAIETSYTLYAQQYDTYLGFMATHLGEFESTLSMSVSGGNTGPYYHGTSEPHSVNKLWGKDHWDMNDLPENTYACKSGNPCMVSYRTPYEAFTAHQWTCGEDLPIVTHNLPGCGRKYYKCPDYDIPVSHNIFKCTRFDLVMEPGEGYVRDYCDTPFRYCMKYTYDSQGHIATITEAGRCTATHGAGGSASGSHEYNSNDDTDSAVGNHRLNEIIATTITYVCGIEGHIGVANNASNHVAAGCNTPGHFLCDDIDHSPSSCKHLDHFNCDEKTHVKEHCTMTNANGDRCTKELWRCIIPN